MGWVCEGKEGEGLGWVLGGKGRLRLAATECLNWQRLGLCLSATVGFLLIDVSWVLLGADD